nr:hypothetical protein [Tanacetum cinerariifolium]
MSFSAERHGNERFCRRPPVNGIGLRVADSHNVNHPKEDFTPLKTIQRSYNVIREKISFELEGETFELEKGDVKVILPKRSQTILDASLGYVGLYTHHFSISNLRLPIPPFICLKTTWKPSPKKPVIYHRGQEMNFRSFMLGGVDGELNLLPTEGASDGRNSSSEKYINNNAPMIDATPQVYLSNVVENVGDFDDPSYGEDEQTIVGLYISLHLEASKKLKILGKRKVASGVLAKALPLKVQKVSARASKVAGEASNPLDVNSEYDIHEVVAIEEPFVLEKMSGYQPLSKEKYDQAGDALANASYPFLVEYVASPYASLEQLLSKKPPLL